MKLKICGMKYNTSEVAALQPDYLGFIFYGKSPRNFEGNIPEIDLSINKVGVFVDEDFEVIKEAISEHELDVLQLHGNESADVCRHLKSTGVEIIKVFSIKDEFDFSILKPYEDVVDYFLFDTKGKLPGGNGYTFDWSILENYPSTIPYFLSGGIGLNEIENIKAFIKSPASENCYALDVNSKFETEPGLKKINELEKFKNELQH